MDTSKAMEMFRQILFEKEIHFFKDYLETLEEFLRTEAQHAAQSLETLDLGYEPLPDERDGARDEDDYEAEHEQYYEPSPREVEEQLRDRLDIVHNRATLAGFREADANLLRKYIEGKPDLLRISRDEIFLNAAFCSEAFETVKGFFCLLISSGHS